MKLAKILFLGTSIALTVSACGGSPVAPSESYKLGYYEGTQMANPVNQMRAGGVSLACANIWSFDQVSYPDLDKAEYMSGCQDGWRDESSNLGID